MYGYRNNGIEKEFETADALIGYLIENDPRVAFNLRYWFIENCFTYDDLIEYVAEARFEGVNKRDILEDALEQLETEFAENMYEDGEDVFGVYYKED